MTYPTTDFELDIPLVYMEATIPAGITIDAYRRSRPARLSLRRRLIVSIQTRTENQ